MSPRQACRLTGAPLEEVLDLGPQPLGNGFLAGPEEFPDEYFYSLRCGFSPESKLFQLIDQPAPDKMFHDTYAFQSGTSRAMSQHFAEWADQAHADFLSRSPDPLVVEIGSNDGVFLKHIASRGIRNVGVEPSANVAELAEAQGVTVLRQFFSEESAAKILETEGQATLITAANAMCHIPDIAQIARAIGLLLGNDGFLSFEDPYLADVIRLGSYDQIYDEHVFLFSALSVQRIFEEVGLELIDVTPLPTHGGSMRYTLAHKGRYNQSPAVEHTLRAEEEAGLASTETFLEFAQRVENSARDLRELLEMHSEARNVVVAYGATSKSTTVYNYARIRPDLISAVYDSTPTKQHTLTPGMHIPVFPEADFTTSGAKYAFLGAWNHEAEVRAKNTAFEEAGGKWISHVPRVRTFGG